MTSVRYTDISAVTCWQMRHFPSDLACAGRALSLAAVNSSGPKVARVVRRKGYTGATSKPAGDFMSLRLNMNAFDLDRPRAVRSSVGVVELAA
jgi:hypothetical protein